MTFVRALAELQRWTLALVLGIGPLGAEVLAALGHAQVCTCCRSDEVESCCGEGAKEPATPQVSSDGACPCALVAPSGATPCPSVPRASESRGGVRSELDRCHRAVELAWVELLLPAPGGESSPAPPGPGSAPPAGPAGSSRLLGSGRASALGVLRL
jgi:hypothetical protein